MGKMKTNKSIKGRFKVTKNKKLKMNHAGRRHLLTKKPAKRKRRLRKRGLVSEGHAKVYLKVI